MDFDGVCFFSSALILFLQFVVSCPPRILLLVNLMQCVFYKVLTFSWLLPPLPPTVIMFVLCERANNTTRRRTVISIKNIFPDTIMMLAALLAGTTLPFQRIFRLPFEWDYSSDNDCELFLFKILLLYVWAREQK